MKICKTEPINIQNRPNEETKVNKNEVFGNVLLAAEVGVLPSNTHNSRHSPTTSNIKSVPLISLSLDITRSRRDETSVILALSVPGSEWKK